MPTDPDKLLVVANSGRGLAASAVRGGYSVSVYDGFCDEDTRDVSCYCRKIPMDEFGMNSEKLATELLRLNSVEGRTGLIYGAGLENHQQALADVFGRFLLMGNPAELVEQVLDPKRFFSLLDKSAIAYPETRFHPPGDLSARWLQKRPGCGGQGVRFYDGDDADTNESTYYQRYVPGQVMSVLFIANGTDHRIIGYNSLKQTANSFGLPFLYGGAVNRALLTEKTTMLLRRLVEKLVARLQLRGINSVDFILSKGRILVLELNPRPSATLELYEHLVPNGWVRHHVRACLGKLPEPSMIGRSAMVQGQQIIYLSEPMVLPEGIEWPVWVKDRPTPGSALGGGEALCSLYAQGRSVGEVESCLQHRMRMVLTMIGSSQEACNASR